METPRFEHECDGCTFIGHVDGKDVYYCLQGNTMPTIVLRYGDKPEEYRSAIQYFHSLPRELQSRARECLAADPDARLILDILNEAGGQLHVEQLEHRYHERGGS